MIYSYCLVSRCSSTLSTLANFLCKIEQLNGLNKSDDKTLIAILLPPSPRRAIRRHLEKYFIKQGGKQFTESCVHFLSKLSVPWARGHVSPGPEASSLEGAERGSPEGTPALSSTVCLPPAGGRPGSSQIPDTHSFIHLLAHSFILASSVY